MPVTLRQAYNGSSLILRHEKLQFQCCTCTTLTDYYEKSEIHPSFRPSSIASGSTTHPVPLPGNGPPLRGGDSQHAILVPIPFKSGVSLRETKRRSAAKCCVANTLGVRVLLGCNLVNIAPTTRLPRSLRSLSMTASSLFEWY